MENRPWQRHYDYNVPLTIRYPRVPAHYFLNIPAGNFPNKPATNFYGTEITFWDLKQQVLRMANALGEMGVKKGDRIGVHLPNCPQYIIAYYAALNLGAVVVNLNPMYTVAELKALTSDTGVSTLFTFDMVLPNIRPLCQEVDIARVVVTRVTDYIEGFGQSTPKELELEEGWLHFTRLLEGNSSTRLPRIDIAQDDPALIQFTGGTTGLPKGAVSDPCEPGCRHDAVHPVGFGIYGPDTSGKTYGYVRPALFPCLRHHRGIKLGHVQLCHPDPGAAVRTRGIHGTPWKF